MSAQHEPLLVPLLGPRYEDAQEIGQADWDGTTRLSCSCGWTDSRVTAGELQELAGRWRSHLTASTYGMPLQDRPK